MSKPERPLPEPSDLTSPHWEGAKQHKLMVQRCEACGTHIFTPKPACSTCFSADVKWVESSGRGTVYSYTIIHRPPDPSFEVPYCAAIIELDEGWHMVSNIVGSPMESISVGASVEVDYLDVRDMTLPVFRLKK